MDDTYRVLVRGRFGDLDERSRAELLADAPAHDVLSAAFTAEGTLTYDRSLLGFTFRYAVSAVGDHAERDARDEAELRAADALTAAGYPFRDLRATATRMADIAGRGRSR